MIEITETVRVALDVDSVFRYVGDFSHIAQWDPGVVSSRKTTPGPIRAGSEFELRCSFFGLPFFMNYRIVRLDRPRVVVLEGHGKSVHATDTIRFRPEGGGTRIDYTLRLDIGSGGFFFRQLAGCGSRAMARNAARGLARAFRATNRPPEIRPLDRMMDRAVLPGMLTFGKPGYLWRRRSWTPLVESLTGRTVVVTGATSGIGKSIALECARLRADTVVVGRNPVKVDDVCHEIVSETGNPRVRGAVADFSLQEEVRSLARELTRSEKNIHVLINNAGALFGRRQETAEGIERCLAVNLIAPFVLTNLLMPKLQASAPSRIVNVSSGGMYTHKLPVDDLAFETEPYNGAAAYARAKRGLVVLTGIWAQRCRGSGVVVHAMHPGWTDTPGIRKSLPRFYALTQPILRTPRQGADTAVWLAAARQATRATGLFWFDRQPHVTHVFPGTRETEAERRRFLRRLEAITGVPTAP